MDINTRDMDSVFYPGTTALMQAEDSEMVKKLLDLGADIHARDVEGRTALFHCWGDESAKILLAAGADVNAKDNWNKTPLMYSANIDKKIRVFIEAGADIHARDTEGKTALIYYASDPESIEILISHGLDVNDRDCYGRTALMFAQNIDTVNALIAAGANVNAQDKSGETALMGARSEEIANALIAAGAKKNLKNTERVDLSMKLSEALSLRADVQKRIAQLRERLMNNAKVQDGEAPTENPESLLAELDRAISEYEELIKRVNLTNARTVSDGETLTELIARRDTLTLKASIMRIFLKSASEKIDRYSNKEIKVKSTVSVSELQKSVDIGSKQLRELDIRIQELNWTTELI